MGRKRLKRVAALFTTFIVFSGPLLLNEARASRADLVRCRYSEFTELIRAASEPVLASPKSKVTHFARQERALAQALETAPASARALGRKLANEYLADQRIQEAAWTLARVGEKTRSRKIVKDLERTLNSSAIVSKKPFKVHASDLLPGADWTKEQKRAFLNKTPTFLVELEGGVFAIFKPSQNVNRVITSADHEVAAYVVDQWLELNRVPVTVKRTIDGEEGMLQFLVRDAAFTDINGYRFRYPKNVETFDYLIENYDRFGNSNYPFRPGRQGVLIDHSVAFGKTEVPEEARSLKQYLQNYYGMYQITITPSRFADRIPSDSVLQILRRTSDATLRKMLRPWLNQEQIQAFLERKADLLNYAARRNSRTPKGR